jgi:hypothetical protein
MATQTRSPASRKVSRVEPGRRRRKACTGRGISKHSGASGTGSVANFRIGIRRSHHQARSRQCVGLTGSALSGGTAKSKNRREPNWLQRPETHGLHFSLFFMREGNLQPVGDGMHSQDMASTSPHLAALAGYVHSSRKTDIIKASSGSPDAPGELIIKWRQLLVTDRPIDADAETALHSEIALPIAQNGAGPMPGRATHTPRV